MFLLHYVYTPRINNAIESFCVSWNHHPLRTEQNWSPVQIWTNGIADRRNRSLCHVAELHNFEDNITDLRWYGMDWGAPTPSEDDLSLVQVEDLSSPLSVEAYERLNRIDPLQQSDSFGIDIYLSCIEAIQTFDV